jgi:NADH-quinone oxidoreductase subunit C
VSALPERIAAALAQIPHRAHPETDAMPGIAVERQHLHAALEQLRDQAGFASPTLITAIDSKPAGHEPAEPGQGREPRFEVVHQLLSIEHGDRVRLRTAVPEDDARVPSCVDLWPGAAYAERECYDLFGIEFDGHQGLKRLLMPEGYGYHPLRKDFPHEGIEPDRLYRIWDAERRQGWSDRA